ncbi:MAG: sulfotransferase [Thermomicrobiales bacterium]|nr:sulfotransferase [Thermomicrobiales bacterium]
MPVSIAGMHRSGTSMVAKLLHDGGLHLGPEEILLPASADNPEGFWEHEEFVILNDLVLGILGGSWDLPPHPPADWNDARFDQLRAAGRDLVARFAGHDPWGWKDPRNSLTIPFWRSATESLKVVVVVRNPLEVALSLHKRNGFSLPLGLHLWYVYNQAVLAATVREERIVTHFDAYFGDATPEIRRLLAFAGLRSDDRAARRLLGNAAPALKHHTLTIADLLEANLAPAIINLYVDLCAEAEFAPVSDEAARILPQDDRGKPVAADVAGFIAGGGGRIDLWLYEYRRRIQELEVALRLHETSRGELEGRIAERDGMVLEREGRIAERDEKIADRDRTVFRLSHEIGMLRQTATDQTKQIAALSTQTETLLQHEQEVRAMLVSAHDQMLNYDTEIMGTLGGALARYAPGAPAAIYYRQLVDTIRSAAQRFLPEGSIALVASYGDQAMLDLPGRRAIDYPQAAGGVAADYTSVDNAVAIEQLEALRAEGASFLLVPSPAQAWLARQSDLVRYLDEHYPPFVHELGVCTIYRLGEMEGNSVA